MMLFSFVCLYTEVTPSPPSSSTVGALFTRNAFENESGEERQAAGQLGKRPGVCVRWYSGVPCSKDGSSAAVLLWGYLRCGSDKVV